MSKARNGDQVSVHYTGKLDDGTVFDSSEGREPLQFTIGSGQVIPGFEKAVIGMEPGESKSERIAPEEAYGDYSKAKTVEVGRDQFPDNLELNVGQRLQVKDPQDHVTQVVVASLSESSVTLDANHPLAGKDLVFDIELVGIA